MEYLNLVLAEDLKEPLLRDYVREWDQEKLVPHLKKINDFDKWLEVHADERDYQEGKRKTPRIVFFLVTMEGGIIGGISIQKELSNEGQIRLGIRPSERKKGHGKAILGMGLDVCKSLGMEKVLLVCDSNDIVMSKIIISQGGIKDKVVRNKGKLVQYYWINL